MDTISRENNSMLPVGGIVVGVIALLLGVFALMQASKANKRLDAHDAQLAKIDDLEKTANGAVASADAVRKELNGRVQQIQDNFNLVGDKFKEFQVSITRLEDAAKKPVVAGGAKKGGEPVVAGPNEYLVKAGDTGTRIATANHVSVADLQAVNQGLDWTKLHPGQKIKLPVKK